MRHPVPNGPRPGRKRGVGRQERRVLRLMASGPPEEGTGGRGDVGTSHRVAAAVAAEGSAAGRRAVKGEERVLFKADESVFGDSRRT